MPDPVPSEKNPMPVNIRPPTFERRFIAAQTDDANALVALASDESYFVRRQALQNPNTPPWILDLLVRAGASPDLRGKGEFDPDLDSDSLRHSAETGPWARQLAVRHPHTGVDTLAHLLCDGEPKIREWAVVHPNLSPETKRDLIRAGSGSDFQGIAPPDPDLPPAVLHRISRLGPWGEWVVANNPYAPAELLDSLAKSDDWQVRLFVARNLNASSTTVIRLEKDPVEKVQVATSSRQKLAKCRSQ